MKNQIDTREAWGKAVVADVSGMGQSKGAWGRLLESVSAGVGRGAEPSKRWQAKVSEQLAQIEREELLYFLDKWLTGITGPGSRQISSKDGIGERNQATLGGLVWVGVLANAAWLMPKVAMLAGVSYQKIAYGGGIRAARLGNICINALGKMEDALSVSWLCELSRSLNHQGALKLVQQAMEGVAQSVGVAAESLEEWAVPDFGLDAMGTVTHHVGDWEALIEVSDCTRVQTTWQRTLRGGQGDLFGQTQPAEVRRSRPARLDGRQMQQAKWVEVTAWQVEQMLEMQRQRVERLYEKLCVWDFETWYTRYMGHPLMKFIGRELVWRFEDDTAQRVADAIWVGGQYVDAESPEEMMWAKELKGTHVMLWHPLLEGGRADVWQGWLLDNQRVQPFKQAYRERFFAGRSAKELRGTLVRQHQFQALLKQSGWHSKLQGTWAYIRHPLWCTLEEGTQCHVVMQPLVDDAITTRPGAYIYTEVDLLEFHDKEGDLLSHEDVDPVLYSEVLRQLAFAAEISTVLPAQMDEVLKEALGRLRKRALIKDSGHSSESVRMRGLVLSHLIERTHWMRNHMEVSEGFLVCAHQEQEWKIELRSGLVWDPDGQIMDVPVKHDAPRATLPYKGDQTLSQIVARSWKIVTGSIHYVSRDLETRWPTGRRSS